MITLRQPFASAVFLAGKDVENRTWTTEYRGRLWIHAASRPAREDSPVYARRGLWLPEEPLPRGVILGCVDLVDCIKRSGSPWGLRDHWHWLLANPRVLVHPKVAQGGLGLRRVRPLHGELRRARRSRKSS
jgi:hypothetical protein